MDLAVHVGFTYPACDELGVLGAEVDDEYSSVVVGHDLMLGKSTEYLVPSTEYRVPSTAS
jgi:hypothetical protein